MSNLTDITNMSNAELDLLLEGANRTPRPNLNHPEAMRHMNPADAMVADWEAQYEADEAAEYADCGYRAY